VAPEPNIIRYLVFIVQPPILYNHNTHKVSIYTKNCLLCRHGPADFNKLVSLCETIPAHPPYLKRGDEGIRYSSEKYDSLLYETEKKRGDDLTSPLSRSLYGAEGGT
jgi:hypothetical protein